MSAVAMASQNSWENVDELPSKLNKFKRYLAKRHQEELRKQQQTAAEVTESHESPAAGSYYAESEMRDSYLNGNLSIGSNGNIPNDDSALNDNRTSQHFMGQCTASPAKIRRDEMCDVPLNLSISSVSRSHSSAYEPCGQHQQTSTVLQSQNFVHSVSSNSPPPPLVMDMDVDDKFCVDEHFQRSLGSLYTSLQDRSRSPAEHTASAAIRYSPGVLPEYSSLSSDRTMHSARDTQHGRSAVNNSVDEHFSKSLGAVWTKVKAEDSPMKHSGGSSTSTSVDDHFAKALGDTWFKLKSSSSSHHSNSSSPTPAPYPVQTGSPSQRYPVQTGSPAQRYPVQTGSSPQRFRDRNYHN